MSKKKEKQLRYIFRTSSLQVSFTLLAVLGVLALIILKVSLSQDWKDAFADYLDPAIAIGTLIVAGMVWYNEKIENWRATWPKKLHVLYLLEEAGEWKRDFYVLDAPLTGTDDIRSWAQSIAKTVVQNDSLNIYFSGFFIPPPVQDSRNGLQHHAILIFLKKSILDKRSDKISQYDPYGTKPSLIASEPIGHPVQKFIRHIPKSTQP